MKLGGEARLILDAAPDHAYFPDHQLSPAPRATTPVGQIYLPIREHHEIDVPSKAGKGNYSSSI